MIGVYRSGRFGPELRSLRERAGLTQVQLAALVGYDHTLISKLEAGQRVPAIEFASQADDVLNATGVLLALAISARAQVRAGSVASAVREPLVLPVPSASAPGDVSTLLPGDRIQLPTLGVTCPLHPGGCSVVAPGRGLADLVDETDRAATVDAEVLHGFAALLTVYIASDLRAPAHEGMAVVERTLHVLTGLLPRARGKIALGLVQLAARYAELAGWLRAERGQNGIGMIWLQRSLEWSLAADSPATAAEALTDMSKLARLEGDGATALEYSRAAAAVAPRRRWIVAHGKLHQARSHAMLGDHHEFERQACEAQRSIERLSENDQIEAPWLFGPSGEALVTAHLAGALRDLAETVGGRPAARRAVAYAETSLANTPAWMGGSRLLLTLRLADSHACLGDLEAAAAVARPVIGAATAARTTLVQRELSRLRTRLGESFDSY